MIIKSLEDYQKWSKYKSLSNRIQIAEKELIEYAEDGEKPFYGRSSYFGPTYTQEEIDRMKKELKALPTDFEEPVRYK
jgi:hypothetical protein